MTISGAARSGSTISDLLKAKPTKAVLDRFNQLRQPKETAICRQWWCGAGCDLAGDDKCCQYGSHYIVDQVEDDALAFARALAAAEGRTCTASAVDDADKFP